jgi:hypothetical protein
MHTQHVLDEGYDCSWCHGFARPERSLTMPPWLFRDGFESASTAAWSATR